MPRRLPRGWWLGCFGLLAAALLSAYRPALDGPFLSDDSLLVTGLAGGYALDLGFVAAAFDPAGDLRFLIGNYAPLYLVASRAESAVFGETTRGYHVVNVLLHALNATLLLALFARSGIAWLWAGLGAALFAFHPADVEAVAWISQLRTLLALACSLGALLALRRAPAAGLLLFAAALLFKVTAVACLAAAVALWWATRGAAPGAAVSGRWLLGWALVLALYAAPQLHVLAMVGAVAAPGYENAATHLRSVGAIGARYLAMAASSYGTSAFHEPEPVGSWTDAWWLAAWPLAALLGGRLAFTLAARREEAMYWAMAAAAFLPVSQIVPAYFGMADRYLYFVLPGLLGGALLCWQGLRAKRRWLARLEPALQVAAVVLVVGFAARSEGRAALWQSEGRLLGDAASQYPNGAMAHFVRAAQAAQAGRQAEALAELRGAVDRRLYLVSDLPEDPALAALRGLPEFQELAREIHRRQIEYARARGYETQPQLRHMAASYLALGEYEQAERVLEEALRRGGPLYDQLLLDLSSVRELRRRRSPQRPPEAPERTGPR
jgi:hypothetical protein